MSFGVFYNFSFRRSNALATTIIELAAIINAAHSGRKMIPNGINKPAAAGIATALYNAPPVK